MFSCYFCVIASHCKLSRLKDRYLRDHFLILPRLEASCLPRKPATRHRG